MANKTTKRRSLVARLSRLARGKMFEVWKAPIKDMKPYLDDHVRTDLRIVKDCNKYMKELEAQAKQFAQTKSISAKERELFKKAWNKWRDGMRLLQLQTNFAIRDMARALQKIGKK